MHVCKVMTLHAIQIMAPVLHYEPGFLAARSLSLLSVLLTMATLKPSLAHLRTHDMPVPGPTPNTTHTLPAMIYFERERRVSLNTLRGGNRVAGRRCSHIKGA